MICFQHVLKQKSIVSSTMYIPIMEVSNDTDFYICLQDEQVNAS